MKPTISVIIPIYNIEKYLRQCIDSVLNQSYMPSEILLINDGSTDGSPSVCKEYEKKYPNLIKVIDKQNGGLSSARNIGILSSGGGYCYFIDGDDIVHEDTLQSFVNILQQYGELDFIHGRMSFFYDGDIKNDYRVQNYYIDNSWAGGISIGQEAFCNAYKNQGTLQMGVRGLYKREFLLKNDLFFVEKKIPWGEDEEWSPRVFLFAEKCAGNDKPYYFYREQRVGSETSKFGNLNTAMTMIDVYNGWLNLLEDSSCTDVFRNELQKESGRRFLACLVKNSRSLCRKDFRVFLDYAEKKKTPLTFAKPNGKMKIVKSMVTLLGIKRSGKMIRMVSKLLKR